MRKPISSYIISYDGTTIAHNPHTNIPPQIITRPLRIIMSTTASYVPTLFNWLLYYRQICPDMSSLFFLCMDRDSEKMMQKYGLRCDHYHGVRICNNNSS